MTFARDIERDSLKSNKIYVKLSDLPSHNCSSSGWTQSGLLRSQQILCNLQILSPFPPVNYPLVSVLLLLSVIFQLSPICCSNYTSDTSNLERQFQAQWVEMKKLIKMSSSPEKSIFISMLRRKSVSYSGFRYD